MVHLVFASAITPRWHSAVQGTVVRNQEPIPPPTTTTTHHNPPQPSHLCHKLCCGHRPDPKQARQTSRPHPKISTAQSFCRDCLPAQAPDASQILWRLKRLTKSDNHACVERHQAVSRECGQLQQGQGEDGARTAGDERAQRLRNRPGSLGGARRACASTAGSGSCTQQSHSHNSECLLSALCTSRLGTRHRLKRSRTASGLRSTAAS